MPNLDESRRANFSLTIMKKKKTKKRSAWPRRRSLIRTGLAVAALLVLGCLVLSLAYGWYLSQGIETRFAGRKWKIPSTVYSDTTLLFPGKRLDYSALAEKLKRLGYRQRSSPPEKMGEYCLNGEALQIFFKDRNLPGGSRDGQAVVITLDSDLIRDIRLVENDAPLPLAELEPEVLMQFFARERESRRLVSLTDIPGHLPQAVIAIEDTRFYRHYGIDPIGILRAFYANLRYGEIRQGGSTLTQQLAKNYFLTPERTLRRKIKESFLALAMEVKYSKAEILEIYLNEIYFGQKGSVSINGVGQAADFYFGKEPKHLTLAESALLAGIIKGPNLFSPYTHPEKCLARRNQVLAAMQAAGFISRAVYESAVDEPIKTVGYRKYNRRAPYFLDYVSDQLHQLYPETTLSSQGFSIYTTLDTDVQAAAEQALVNGLTRLEEQIPALRRTAPEKKLQGAVLVIQPRTGNILAMVGGRDYDTSQFNRVTQARRQPGSCFKPIVTATLLDVFKPSDRFSNEEKSYLINGRPWTPDNYGDIPGQTLSLRDMLRLSCNRAAVDMAVRGGVEKVAERLRTFYFSTPFAPYPSIALGAFEVIPLELARAYCAFAADGVQPFPLSVRDVIDEYGHLLVCRHMDIHPVLSPAEAWLITSMLESVVQDGTARSLKRLGVDFPLAGKTGTTNEYRDAWFIGYTPDFLALIWVGFDNGDPVYSTGSGAALPIFAELVQAMPGYISRNPFTMPPGIVKQKVCRQSGELAVFLKCPETDEEYFLENNQPTEKCHVHGETNTFKRFFNGVKNIFK